MSARVVVKSLAVVAGLFAFWQSSFVIAAAPLDDCAPTQIDKQVKVNIVYDGGSFLIGNDYVTLTGVHVPVASRQLESPQPLGKAVAQAVGELIKRSDRQLNLEFDQQPSYKGQVLVHAYLKDGRNLALTLLKNGFAIVDTQLPNLKHAQCYRAAEAEARAAKKGLWQYQNLGVPVIESTKLTGDRAGFQIVRGKVLRAEQGENYFILNMDTVAIRIDQEAMKLFDRQALLALKGRTIEVRDDFAFYKNYMIAFLEHPGQIDVFADQFYAKALKQSVANTKK